jgi:hypothetical protein
MQKLISILAVLLFITSCEEKSTQNQDRTEYISEGKAALVMVVENSDRANQQIEDIAFNSYPSETRQIFSEVFEVPIDSLLNKDLNQILDQYGEPWQIAEINKVAQDYYLKTIDLTDQYANAEYLIQQLDLLSKEEYNIDLVFSLHGTSTNIQFVNESVPIKEFTETLSQKNIKVRVLYQTNCKSAKALDNWTNIGVAGCNGTIENNYLTIFAPINFVKSWVGGHSYYDAVKYAYDEEIIALKSYNDVLPILDYITSGNYLSGSYPVISGTYFNITKEDYLIVRAD